MAYVVYLAATAAVVSALGYRRCTRLGTRNLGTLSPMGKEEQGQEHTCAKNTDQGQGQKRAVSPFSDIGSSSGNEVLGKNVCSETPPQDTQRIHLDGKGVAGITSALDSDPSLSGSGKGLSSSPTIEKDITRAKVTLEQSQQEIDEDRASFHGGDLGSFHGDNSSTHELTDDEYNGRCPKTPQRATSAPEPRITILKRQNFSELQQASNVTHASPSSNTPERTAFRMLSNKKKTKRKRHSDDEKENPSHKSNCVPFLHRNIKKTRVTYVEESEFDSDLERIAQRNRVLAHVQDRVDDRRSPEQVASSIPPADYDGNQKRPRRSYPKVDYSFKKFYQTCDKALMEYNNDGHPDRMILTINNMGKL